VPDSVNKLAKINVEGDASFARHYSQLTDAVNTLLGFNGAIPLQNHIDLKGNLVRGLGQPQAPTDAVSSGVANNKYSAAALKAQIEAGGPSSLNSYRILNSQSQREGTSSWLNDLMSSVPSANGILPSILNIGGGAVQVTLPAENFTFADGSNILLQSRTDILSPPTSFSIGAISATSNVVSVTTGATGLVTGDVMTVVNVTPPSFNGSYIITSSSGGGAFLTYNANLGTLAGSGGQVEIANVYYYAVRKRETTVQLLGPFNGDTAQNRLNANFDGFQIVAVVVLTASGGQISQSGGGGSPILGSPAAGSFF